MYEDSNVRSVTLTSSNRNAQQRMAKYSPARTPTD